MKKFTELLSTILGLSFFAGILYIIYRVCILIFENFSKIDINIFVAIIGGTITISSFFITRYLERKKTIEFEIRNKKIPIYEEFFDFYFKVVFKRDDQELTNEDMVNFFRQFSQKAIIWFPDNILKSYIKWKKNLITFSQVPNADLKEMILNQEEFMNLIRKDIGHSNKNLLPGDISSIYINDLDNYL
ncbi:hypothetical protein [Flavobacterium sp. B17]|uniref:hypothetical protein n=1 Tax=Flavobacterium sp. B17 TaxID=95618 RepID=UPI0003483066|nr:hypothetical protein [Flavobacterium sp. B17]